MLLSNKYAIVARLLLDTSYDRSQVVRLAKQVWSLCFDTSPSSYSTVIGYKYHKVKAASINNILDSVPVDCQMVTIDDKPIEKAKEPLKFKRQILALPIKQHLIVSALADEDDLPKLAEVFRMTLRYLAKSSQLLLGYQYAVSSCEAPVFSELGMNCQVLKTYQSREAARWESKRISHWEIYTNNNMLAPYRDRMIGEVRDFTILTQSHLNLRVGNMRFDDWILSGKGARGNLNLLTSGMAEWIVGPHCNREAMNIELFEKKVIMGWWPLGQTEPDITRSISEYTWSDQIPESIRTTWFKSGSNGPAT